MKHATFFQDSLRADPHFVVKCFILLGKTKKKVVG